MCAIDFVCLVLLCFNLLFRCLFFFFLFFCLFCFDLIRFGFFSLIITIIIINAIITIIAILFIMIIIVTISIISIIIILSRQGLIYFVLGVSLKGEELDQKSCEQFLDMCHKVMMGEGGGRVFKNPARALPTPH